MSTACSVLIPAHNEAGYIGPCLEALLASDPVDAAIEVIVMANGCSDDTVALAPVVRAAGSAFTRAYARFWASLPFVTHGVPGFGVFAVNAAARARWGAFPDIISDDTFVRLSFKPQERHRVPATYEWPMIEGAGPLIRVRRRQDIGVAEVKSLFPALWENHDPVPSDAPPFWRRALRDPLGFAAFAVVGVAVRLPHRKQERWARGR